MKTLKLAGSLFVVIVSLLAVRACFVSVDATLAKEQAVREKYQAQFYEHQRATEKHCRDKGGVPIWTDMNSYYPRVERCDLGCK